MQNRIQITRDLLSSMIEEGKSINQIAKDFSCSPTKIMYWTRAYGLKSKHSAFTLGSSAIPQCSCGEKDPKKFYGHKKTVCATCHRERAVRLHQEKKIRAVELKGGSCYLCGYNRCMAAIDFHHVDPNEKDKQGFENLMHKSWDNILKELEKCVPLCRNCHSEVHGGFICIMQD